MSLDIEIQSETPHINKEKTNSSISKKDRKKPKLKINFNNELEVETSNKEDISPSSRSQPQSPGLTHKSMKKLVQKQQHIIHYDPDKTPPDIEEALNHAKAKRIAKPIKKYNEIELLENFCQCCGFSYNNELLPLNCHRNELSFLGSGIPLYLEFVKFGVGLLLIIGITFSIYNIYSNIVGSSCYTLISEDIDNSTKQNNTDIDCHETIFSIVSLINKKNEEFLVILQNWFCLITTIFIIVYLQIFDDAQKKTEQICDDQLISPSDYTIMIENVINDDGFEENEIKNFIENKWKEIIIEIKNKKNNIWSHHNNNKYVDAIINVQLEIKKFIQSYQINNFINLIKKKKKLMKKKNLKVFDIKLFFIKKKMTHSFLDQIDKKFFRNQNLCESPSNINREFINELNLNGVKNKKISKIYSEIDEIDKKLIQITILTDEIVFTKKNPIIFVTFNLQEHAEIFTKRFQISFLRKLLSNFNLLSNSKYLIYKNNLLHVKRAPEPSDILWENLNFTEIKRVKIRIISLFLSVVALLISCIVITLFIFVNKFFENFASQNIQNDSIFFMFVIKLIRFLNSIFIIIVNGILFHAIDYASIFEKHKTITSCQASYSLKFTSAQFLNITVNVLLSGLIIDGKNNIWKENGVLTDILLISLANLIISPLGTLLDYNYLSKILKKKKILKLQKTRLFTQSDANYYFEGPQLNLANKYCTVMTTLWFTAFYTPIHPLCPFIAIICLILNYLTDKYVILRRHTRPSISSNFLNICMHTYISMVPILFSLGNLIFTYLLFDFNNSNQIINLLCVSLSVLNIIYPWKKIFMKFYQLTFFLISTLKKNKNKIKKTEIQESIKIPYEEVYKNFTTDYERTNPITQDESMLEWFKNLKFEGSKKKVKAASHYFATMMRLFQNTKTSVQRYANKKLSDRLNRNPNNVFEDRMFGKTVNKSNGIFQGLIIKRSISAFKDLISKKHLSEMKSGSLEKESNTNNLNEDSIKNSDDINSNSMPITKIKENISNFKSQKTYDDSEFNIRESMQDCEKKNYLSEKVDFLKNDHIFFSDLNIKFTQRNE